MMEQYSPPSPAYKLALFACVIAVIVIALGAFTRLADAGLGCPDWPTCYGHVLWPETDHEVQKANLAYPGMPVAHDKTWPEMIHRYFASSLGLLTLILAAMAFKARRNKHPRAALKHSCILVAIIIMQGLFGMWTVTLKLWPQVVTMHLLGGFATFSLLWLLALRLKGHFWSLLQATWTQCQSLKKFAIAALIMVIIQIALGGWTTSNYAAVACPDLPTCQAQWWPAMDFAKGFNVLQHVGPNYLGGTMTNEARMAIHYSHRLGALATTLILVLLITKLFLMAEKNTQSIATVLLGVLILQVSLGLANVLLNFPIAVAVAHNLVGALLLISVITLNYRLFSATVVDAK